MTLFLSTDVHEFSKELVVSVLKEAGAKVYDIGTNVATREIAEAVVETASQFIAVSTFNGIALSYATELLEALKSYDLDNPVFMGGLLNENQENGNLPVDVTGQLKDLGMICCSSADQIIQKIKDRN